MNNYTIMKERNPQAAEFLERWEAKYGRFFDLKTQAERASLYEGLLEMARFISQNNQTAKIDMRISTEGISSLEMQVS